MFCKTCKSHLQQAQAIPTCSTVPSIFLMPPVRCRIPTAAAPGAADHSLILHLPLNVVRNHTVVVKQTQGAVAAIRQSAAPRRPCARSLGFKPKTHTAAHLSCPGWRMSDPRGDPQCGSTPAECTVRTAHTPERRKQSVLVRTKNTRSTCDVDQETGGAPVNWVVDRSSLCRIALGLIACDLLQQAAWATGGSGATCHLAACART